MIEVAEYERSVRRMERDYRRDRVKNNFTQEDRHSWHSEIALEQELLGISKSNVYRLKADFYDIEMPTGDEFYEKDLLTRAYCLNAKGRSEIRNRIAAESALIRDQWRFWFVSLSGMIGIVTGLVAVWRS